MPAAGTYGVWLGGSFRDKVSIAVDATPVGSQTGQFSENGQAVPFGSVRLSKGLHIFTIAYARDRLRPGEGSYPFGLGPLELGSPATNATARHRRARRRELALRQGARLDRGGHPERLIASAYSSS